MRGRKKGCVLLKWGSRKFIFQIISQKREGSQTKSFIFPGRLPLSSVSRTPAAGIQAGIPASRSDWSGTQGRGEDLFSSGCWASITGDKEASNSTDSAVASREEYDEPWLFSSTSVSNNTCLKYAHSAKRQRVQSSLEFWVGLTNLSALLPWGRHHLYAKNSPFPDGYKITLTDCFNLHVMEKLDKCIIRGT